ncbi:hypothetical protein MUU72_25735 [Streptomyces sp. RS10V-4]|uniref:hypothetical protein n=1 Tax=Streptomyces rhizoryzae TaxID=2932493 RepID=UPI0020049515|nr:hypothetical protein [Streptomyces rhizoryzae]MCK7626464.1 hypothetical protein [Streptomyces rhizoryzae]
MAEQREPGAERGRERGRAEGRARRGRRARDEERARDEDRGTGPAAQEARDTGAPGDRAPADRSLFPTFSHRDD